MTPHLPHIETNIQYVLRSTPMQKESFIVCPVEDLNDLSVAMIYSGHPTLEDAKKEYEEQMKNPVTIPKEGGGVIELKWVIVKCNVSMERIKP